MAVQFISLFSLVSCECLVWCSDARDGDGGGGREESATNGRCRIAITICD